MTPDLGSLPVLIGLIVSAAAQCALVVTFSFPLVKSLFKSARRRIELSDEDEPDVYQDEDGTATESSQDSYHPIIPKICMFLGTFAGFIFSITLSVNDTIHKRNSELVVGWMYTTSWVCSTTPCPRARTLADRLRFFYL